MPGCIADLAAARPIDLAIIDGIESITSGHAPGPLSTYVKPHLLIAGTNAVCVDAVGTAVMGFDPMADRGVAPFETCDNTMRLAEEVGRGVEGFETDRGHRREDRSGDHRLPPSLGPPGSLAQARLTWPDEPRRILV